MPSVTSTRNKIQWPRHPTFGHPLPPIWPSEPSLAHLESLTRAHLSIPENVPCTIEHFAEGSFNKLYAISSPSFTQQYLIRVALPAEPRLKTLSEVATIEFVRMCATELAPRVLAYEADGEAGELGYEWMIMERVSGGPLEEQWEDMEWDAKVALVKALVGVVAKLYDHPLCGIGNIYPSDASSSDSTPEAGRIVSLTFFWDDHYTQDVPRGPFHSSHDWLQACLQITLNDCTKILTRPIAEDDEYDKEEADFTRALAERLVQLLPRVFPPSQSGASEPTFVHQDDLSMNNLLIDDSGKLTGIVDWECVSALPLWRACSLPSFLEGRPRKKQPKPEEYMRDEDGRSNRLYWEHLLEWEQTQLRTVFLEEMRRVQPEWVRVHEDSENVLKNDFYEAVMGCDSELYKRRIREWVDRVEGMSLEEIRAPGGGYRPLYYQEPVDVM